MHVIKLALLSEIPLAISTKFQQMSFCIVMLPIRNKHSRFQVLLLNKSSVSNRTGNHAIRD